jgi:hypothetical protein
MDTALAESAPGLYFVKVPAIRAAPVTPPPVFFDDAVSVRELPDNT